MVDRDILSMLTSLRKDIRKLQSRKFRLPARLSGDTDWITIPLAAGYVATSVSETPAYRKVGQMTYLKGIVKATTGNLPTSDYTIANAGAIPADAIFDASKYGPSINFDAQGQGAATMSQLRVRSDGGLAIRPPTTSASAYIALYSAFWFND